MQLIRCSEPENAASGGAWVGAHPSLGEKAATALLQSGTFEAELGPIAKLQREVTGVAGTDMRCDFLLTGDDGVQTIVEVKTVVDTDYDPKLTDDGRFPKKAPVFLGKGEPYQRAAIFPWGNSNQKGPDGEKVVSARAIKHVRELTAVAAGERTGPSGERLRAAVLFIVVRRDALLFRPNEDACPSFARYLREAQEAGVKVLARRVRWGGEQMTDGDELGLGNAIDDGSLPIVL